MKIEIYEKNMYGVKGLVNSIMDEESLRIGDDLKQLKNEFKELEVARYEMAIKPRYISSLVNISENDNEYNSRSKVIGQLININTKDIGLISNENLPIVLVNGEIIKSGKYPNIDELRKRIELEKTNINCI
ncbi:arsenical resistance operon transcriptional repressor ArsD [Romboutsia ilealis]|uniref:Arsenic metallochaperone ArsD family protein n=1 Tax=Romboutsia faecis TaxID=2764597 RepID=A0ABR7JMV0_9FIRM|nr:arsenic metallochaperone ArsD family protein [Romboutsia faecis]MBC5996250.1 arsenic metallochaperone ArsD family protein [Romboutsia faecis]MRN25108.1 arsenical resistance operon transcriptional repressor ArsD [Romboutsia ilealis]